MSIHAVRKCSRTVVLALAVAAAMPAAARAQGPRITTPKEHFGFNIGDDYCLANYRQLASYWSILEKESDRLKVVRIGTTEEGRPQLIGVVTSAANHAKLPRLQEIARRLALAEGVNEDEARKLAAEGKAVVWIDGGLHASEVLCAQVLIETLYQFVIGNDPETLRLLDDTIILFVHANPDGMELCADWYMRNPDPKSRSSFGLPRLYEKYGGHDNNRDFYGNNLAETKNMNRVMYHEWFPQIVYNHHQAGPPGTVLFCPPFRDPFNYNVDPLVISGIDAVGAAMMQRFLVENKPGATVRSGTRYSTWWNGGLRTTCYFHNMIGLLTETVGNPTPSAIPYRADLQLPRADYLAPIAPQVWHFRRSVDYSVTANKAVLDYASRHREQLLYNIWLMGKNAIDRGNRDSWTVTPKMVDAARGGRRGGNWGGPEEGAQKAAGGGRGRGGRGGGANTAEFTRYFRDPAKRDPRGYIIPANQPDFLTATKFVNILIATGVTVHRATSEFNVAGKTYPAGSYIVKSAQPFRSHLIDQFEPQDHPNDFAYPGAPPTPPYDIAGWTMAYQMAVKFDRILDGFDGPFERLSGEVPPPPARVIDAEGAVGFVLHRRANDAFRAVNRLLASGEEVQRLREPFSTDGVSHPAGQFFIPKKATTQPLLETIAKQIGTRFIGVRETPGKEAVVLKSVRLGLVDRFGGSMPSGWTRMILERFEFRFQVIYPPDLDNGGLSEKFDVIVLVDGIIGGGGRGGGVGRGSAPGADAGGDQPQVDPAAPAGAEQDIPAEYRGRRGNITTATTVPQLRKFLESGGTILTIGSSTELARQLGLPVRNHLVEFDDEGREYPLPREKFYVPGSLMRVRLDLSNPLTWGLEENVDAMFSGSPTFNLPKGAEEKGLRRVGWYDGKSTLRSGWAWGQANLDGGAAIAEAAVGKGRLVLFGPQILFRAQPHGTFKLFFNGIMQAAMKD
jgi:hypothetical protein